MNKGPTPPESLPVATVRTLGRAGLVDARNWVLCPRFEASVSLSRCLSCEHRETLRVTPAGTEVLCHPTLEHADLGVARASLLGAVHVSEIMARDVICIAEDLSIEEAAHVLAGKGTHGAPVVSREARVLGMITEPAIQEYLRRAGGSDSSSIGQTGLDPVSQAMTRSFVVVGESSAALRAAAVMAHEGVHHLLVSSAEGELVGTLDALAILAWIARADGFLLGAPEARDAFDVGARPSDVLPAVRLTEGAGRRPPQK